MQWSSICSPPHCLHLVGSSGVQTRYSFRAVADLFMPGIVFQLSAVYHAWQQAVVQSAEDSAPGCLAPPGPPPPSPAVSAFIQWDMAFEQQPVWHRADVHAAPSASTASWAGADVLKTSPSLRVNNITLCTSFFWPAELSRHVRVHHAGA